MTKKRAQTLGSMVNEAQHNEPLANNLEEQGQLMTGDYVAELEKAVISGKKAYIGNFYIAVLTKYERILEHGSTQGISRHFYVRATCPTPHYDMAVYRWNEKKTELEFLWVMPDKDSCIELMNDRLNIDPKYYDLLKMVIAAHNGSLLREVKRLNGEADLVQDLVLSIAEQS